MAKGDSLGIVAMIDLKFMYVGRSIMSFKQSL